MVKLVKYFSVSICIKCLNDEAAHKNLINYYLPSVNKLEIYFFFQIKSNFKTSWSKNIDIAHRTWFIALYHFKYFHFNFLI